MILFDAAVPFNSPFYTFDGNLLVVGTTGFEALFTTIPPARLTDMPREQVDPRGYMTGRLPETKSFWL